MASLDEERRAIETVMAAWPELSDFAFGVYEAGRKSPDERQRELADERQKMLEPRSLQQFADARAWLRQFSKLSRPNRAGTSYGLKHAAERRIGYITNGMFIAAALAEGFTVTRADSGSPNVWFNISSRAWSTAR